MEVLALPFLASSVAVFLFASAWMIYRPKTYRRSREKPPTPPPARARRRL
ncbi:MAG: hypothetical protein JWR59_211 [Brevundimonas sp.]|nr:hypothetical protein [Brevundimonas sp.]